MVRRRRGRESEREVTKSFIILYNGVRWGGREGSRERKREREEYRN